MSRAHIDQAFSRYHATGDPRALAVVFDATASELYRLAWHLVGERNAAEDLVQTAFLTAIEDAASFEPGREVLPWLCGILANRARDARRRERLRHAARAHTRDESTADPVSEASTRELEQALAEQVRALPEPYRHVLILHLEHGLGAKEIAEAHDRPAATVRSQIQRGLDLVRRALPAGFAAGITACPPPGGLDRVREIVLAHSGGSAATVGTAGTVATAAAVVGGVMAMKSAVSVSGLGAILLLATWPLWPSGAVERAEAPQSSASRNEHGRAETLAAEVGEQGAAVRRTVTPGVPTAGLRGTALEVTVSWEEDGGAARDVAVRWRPHHRDGMLLERMARTDGSGVARFEGLLAGTASGGGGPRGVRQDRARQGRSRWARDRHPVRR